MELRPFAMETMRNYSCLVMRWSDIGIQCSSPRNRRQLYDPDCNSPLASFISPVCSMGGIVAQLDEQIAEILAGWNIYTTIISAALLGFIGWVILDTQEADTHPLLLARQAQASYVRQPGESAVFRSPETPHGCM